MAYKMRKPDFCFGPFPDRLVSNMAMEKIWGERDHNWEYGFTLGESQEKLDAHMYHMYILPFNQKLKSQTNGQPAQVMKDITRLMD